MDDLLRSVAHRATRYLDSLATRGVAPAPAAVEGLRDLGGPLPEGPTDPEAVVALLDDIGSPATVVNAGGRYFGFVNVSSWATTEEDVEKSLAAMLRVARRATAPGVSRRPEDARAER